MCEIGRVSSIDHYLPRSLYPEFAILSGNLVPVCERCNRLKGDDCVVDGGRTYFHCYLDVPIATPVVMVDIFLGDGVGVTYRLEPASDVDLHAYAKLEAHYEVFGLARHYQEEATAQLLSSVDGFHDVFTTQGSAGLRRFLAVERDARIARLGVNNWEAALYRSLSSSTEFQSGGYDMLLTSR